MLVLLQIDHSRLIDLFTQLLFACPWAALLLLRPETAIMALPCMDGVELRHEFCFLPFLIWVLVLVKNLTHGLLSKDAKSSAE